MQKWASAYQQQFPGVAVKVTGGGSTQGIDYASSGKVDIGASDAYLSSGDVLKNTSLLNIPLVVSAQSVIYNVPGLPPGSHVQLTGAVLAAMYSGAITMWNDPHVKVLNGASPPGCRPSRSHHCTARAAPVTRSCSPATCPPRTPPGTPRSGTGRR